MQATTTTATRPTRSRPRLATAAAGLAALLLVSLLTVRTSQAVFTAQTANEDNSFATGTVSFDATGAAMFSLANMRPGTTATRCVDVSYTGSIATAPETVAIRTAYPAPAGTDLGTALLVTLEEGTAGSTCAAFTTGDTIAAVTDGDSLADLTTARSGSWSPDPATDAVRPYRVTVTLPLSVDDTFQGLSLTGVDFIWDVRSPSTTDVR